MFGDQNMIMGLINQFMKATQTMMQALYHQQQQKAGKMQLEQISVLL